MLQFTSTDQCFDSVYRVTAKALACNAVPAVLKSSLLMEPAKVEITAEKLGD